MWIIPEQASVSFPVSADLTSDSSEQFPDFEPWVTVSGTATQRPFSWRGWKTRPWIQRLYGSGIYRSLTLLHFSEWISFTAASRAKIYPSPAGEPELTENEAGSGANSLALLGKFDPDTYLLKMSQVCLLTQQCEEFSATFPRSGSMQSGQVFERPTLARRTGGSGFSYWQTPKADTAGSGFSTSGYPMLKAQAAMWPTPTEDGNYNRKGLSATSGDGLATASKMWATPHANITTGAGSQGRDGGDNIQTQAATFHLTHPGPETLPHGNTSSNDGPNSRRQWQTPRTGRHGTPGEGKGHGGQPKGKRLNPFFVEWLMNFPIGWTLPYSIAKSDCDASAMPLSQRKPPPRGMSCGA